MVTIPDSHKDLLDKAIGVTLATVMPDNTPQNTVLWFNWTGEKLQMSTTAGRQKEENIRRNPKVSAILVDPENMYRYLEIRGTAEITNVNDSAAYALADKLTKKYTGKDNFYGDVAPAEAKATQTRVILNVIPEHVVTYG